jgi:hypothetical protein
VSVSGDSTPRVSVSGDSTPRVSVSGDSTPRVSNEIAALIRGETRADAPEGICPRCLIEHDYDEPESGVMAVAIRDRWLAGCAYAARASNEARDFLAVESVRQQWREGCDLARAVHTREDDYPEVVLAALYCAVCVKWADGVRFARGWLVDYLDARGFLLDECAHDLAIAGAKAFAMSWAEGCELLRSFRDMIARKEWIAVEQSMRA